ncbi:Long-chain-fatty-acid--CoA ligase [Hyphomicrobium sp. GJ21]|uniref:long-chain-fatty-acid--CoA ligase n=1 Tax=Hyphomicrobium sp. GJ21 TaxID=113574 RepID=UPI000622C092|nr:long-chain fatty acid--CoA ligase [Hyphomicrobium sp. GJ21]CEJ84752.1 Long-chain-fatty-acid--CoA ligase [Hyphomicrobium sp. GJ21]
MTPEATQPPGSPNPPWIASYPPEIDWFMPISTGPVPELLERALRRFPHNPAISFLGRTTSYAELAAEVDRVTAGLQKSGIGRGTKVGLFLPNTPTFIVYYYAILKAGGTVVNFNPLYTLEELTFQARDSETEVMVTHDLAALFPKLEELMLRGVVARTIVVPFRSVLPPLKGLLFSIFKRGDIANVAGSRAADKVIDGARLSATSEPPTPVAINADEDVAVLQYTGGTTGTPKGAMLTHANLTANTAQIMAWGVNLKPGEESILGALPLFHVFAMTVVMNMAVELAAKIILIPRFRLIEALKLIDREKPTVLPAVPTILTAMLHYPKFKSYDVSSLRFCLSGGAPLPIEVKLQFEEVSGSKVVEGYGLSEASPVLTCNPVHMEPVAGSIGPPLPGTIISLRDLDDPTKEVPQGERGELCAKGPQVMKGYWKKPEETAKQFVGDFLRTGDVAIMDKNGYFSIVDRIKDLIICSGYNVYPRRIEDAIYQHPAVEEVTVIGIPDDYRGEAPKAFIKLKAGMTATAADIQKHLETKISKIELPAQIEFRDALPKTMIGKLSKKELVAEERKKRE